MRIVINYNGSIAECWITDEFWGNPDALVGFRSASPQGQAFALDAFRTISSQHARDKREQNK